MVNLRREKGEIVFFTEFEIMKPWQGRYVKKMDLVGKLGLD